LTDRSTIERFAAVCLVVAAVVGAQENRDRARAADNTALNTDCVIIDHDTDLPNAEVKKNDVRRVTAALEKLPQNHRLRLEFHTFGAGGGKGPPLRYIQRITPLNPDGNPDGVEIVYGDWYRQPVRLTPFQNGRQHGIERIYTRGEASLRAEIPWNQGVVHGLKRAFHESGPLANETTYLNGEPEGESRSFAVSGQLVRVAHFNNGKRHGEVTDYWPGRGKTVKRIVTYHYGKVHGPSRAFYADGQVKWERMFQDNEMHGVERHFTADGKVEKERWWLNGKEVDRATYRETEGK